MNGIDWPLAILLGAIFVAISLLRWRHFKARARRLRSPAPPDAPRPGED